MPPKLVRKISARSPQFETYCLDHGIYAPDYGNLDGEAIRPSNFGDIQRAIVAPRTCTPTEQDFQRFQKMVQRSTEAKAGNILINILRNGLESSVPYEQGAQFSNLTPLIAPVEDDPGLVEPKPDYYEGSSPTSINTKVLKDLAKTIIPTQHDDYPVLPNYLLEFKSIDGSRRVCYCQAMYDGALGARAMQSMLSYGKLQNTTDDTARVLTATFDGAIVAMYAHHVRTSSSDPTKLEYYTTCLQIWCITWNYTQFKEAINALRNGQELAAKWREEAIRGASLMLEGSGSGE